MRVLIIGDGKVGHSLAGQLILEGHEVTIVDRSEAALQRSMDTLDAMAVKGNGVNADTLREAGAPDADIVIAVTVSDEINMLACLTAKRLGAKYAIARIRDPEYHKSLPFLMKELLIDYVINPERILAQEISRILRYPFTGSIETFARGRVELMDFRLGPGDALAGHSLRDLYAHKPSLPRVLFCAVQRGEEALIPKGDLVLQADDHVYVASDVPTITAFFKAIGKNTSGVRSVMLMGAGRIAYYLAEMLLKMHIQVTVVELDEEVAQEFSEALPQARVILGDGTDQELLSGEGLDTYDAFVTLSGLDEENIMAGLYAQRLGVRKVVVKTSRDNYQELLGSLGLDSAVSVKQSTGDTILRAVRTRSAADAAAAVERLYHIIDGEIEALEFIARQEDRVLGAPLMELALRPDALIAVIVRDGQVYIPTGRDTLREGDRVIVMVKGGGVERLDDILGGQA
ncbi:MAG: Trk system potassium transporter TrkA [Clostridiales bacterium]|nr:Trk system potassium transporter TrkA [Clostridiales bacterium]